MFDQVFTNLQKATESSVKMQQEMFRQWFEAFPSASAGAPISNDFVGQWLKKWEETSAEMLKQQKDLVDRNYEAGIQALEDMFHVAESKSPQEYQEKVTELYRKSFESLRQLTESQMNEFKAAAEKWSKLVPTSTTD
jgi:2-succinyl-5-enolpyruvyl-6-hydroxy-3-cyclohexene-1-carboxylate synthase